MVRWLVLSLVSGAFVVGCGGRTGNGGPPEGVKRDSRASDGNRDRKSTLDRWQQPDNPGPWMDRYRVPDLPKKLDGPKTCVDLGESCTAGSCCGGLSCVIFGTNAKICTSTCTPDDPFTPLVNEDSCPNLAQYQCGNQYASTTSSHYCLRRCTPTIGQASCPAGLACHPKSVGYSADALEALCVYPACTQAKDCPVRLASSCGNPGGACTGAAGAFCAEDEDSLTGFTCALAGSCDLKSGLCQPHSFGGTGVVGAVCKDDRDCKAQMRCDRERFLGGELHARNGYCIIEGCAFAKTLPQRACPAGSSCQRLLPGGFCFKTCSLSKASDCRGNPADNHGDYECYAWNNLVTGSVMIADVPVCEPADRYPCNLLTSSKLDCSALGVSPGNSTQMACRDRQTGAALPNPSSPLGLCLDTTSSGN
jgi:hypothetical protein